MNRKDSRKMDRYCKRFIGLRLVVEKSDEEDSWKEVSQNAVGGKNESMQTVNQRIEVNLKII